MHRYAAYVTEFIGAFFLMLTVGTSVLSGSALAPVAIGAVLMVMVYAGAHVSGGLYNPSLTLAALVRRRLGRPDAVAYWAAQILGGIIGAAVALWAVNPARTRTLSPQGRALAAALLVELLFTFALAYVMLNVATSRSNPNASFYGLAIGFTVAAGGIAVGRISGAAFNPAVTLGLTAMGLLPWYVTLLYLIVQLLAGAGAGMAFLALNPDEALARPRRESVKTAGAAP
ncbi:aquaporin [Dactylosporangium sp. CA-233914]|uniref:aquaporin n=1 Tax=Dactylosporangium sp. CA-233914 TaxID=3239934 RepID=UPI003D93DD05